MADLKIMMELEEIERQTRLALPEWSEAKLQSAVIEKGGSGRLFVRMTDLDTGESLIAMHYSLDRADNPRFASITDFLLEQGVPVPRISARREDLCLLWVEDLGAIDLGNLAGTDWNTSRRPAYELALRAVFPLHNLCEDNPPKGLPELELPFDEKLYRWEQNYFFTNYVERFHSPELADRLRELPVFGELARELSTLPRSLLHRDFQSTNVMLRDGHCYLIDYQGLRWGLPEYDLASMIYDPYSEFSAGETQELIDFYFALKEGAGHAESRAEFERRLVQCAMQRLMQALGAYGFLGEVKGMTEFLSHIPVAKERLLKLSQEEGGLNILSDWLGSSE